MSQNIGIRTGLTTGTLTGNQDAYKFNFLESFSIGYKLGVLVDQRLSDVIIVKPEISYRLYKINQKIDSITNDIYDLEQAHQTLAVDLNFDIELSNKWSLIFGMGLDYLISQKNTLSLQNFTEVHYKDFNSYNSDERLDPFATVGLCYKLGRSILLDLEYRHLLDNWAMVSLNNNNTVTYLTSRNIKLHMINCSLAVLF